VVFTQAREVFEKFRVELGGRQGRLKIIPAGFLKMPTCP